jgi:hypothetical protein
MQISKASYLYMSKRKTETDVSSRESGMRSGGQKRVTSKEQILIRETEVEEYNKVQTLVTSQCFLTT